MSQQAQAVVQAQPKTTGASSFRGEILQRAAVIPAIAPVHSGILQRCSGGVECAECRAKREMREKLMQRAAVNSTSANTVPPIVHEVLGSSGQPLDAGTRAFMEPRFGYDFSHVRVHTGDRAAESARAVNAVAYTVGHNVVFGEGMYAPETSAGRRLLAHELTHVVQQSSDALQSKLTIGAPGGVYEQEADRVADSVTNESVAQVQPEAITSPIAPSIQRTCGPSALGSPHPDCTPSTGDVSGEVFYFVVNCDDLQPGESGHLTSFAAGLSPGTDLHVHGYASTDGDASFNMALSCHRANKVAAMLRTARPDLTITTPNLKHGATPGPASYRRSVVVETITPPTCGPDATDWFVRQVNAATTDAKILSIQAEIKAADIIARRHGTTAHEVAEGGAAAAVVAQVARMGSKAPPLNPVISSQLLAGETSGSAAVLSLKSHPVDAAEIAVRIERAATEWKALVNHGMRYDFKAHTMRSPTTAHCPAPSCRNTITLCPGAAPENCFLTDLPGNFFYALIGRFLGWSELTLQLGSQLAQLTGTATWDPPEDTAAIHLGFALPLPLTVSALCSSLPGKSGSLTSKSGCSDCKEPTTAIIK